MPEILNIIFVSLVLVLITAELYIDHREQKQLYEKNDTLQTACMGGGLFLVGFVNRAVVVFLYWLVYQYRLFTLENSWGIVLLAFILTDFCSYWYHRCAHSVNWLWASHSVHHSSEQFNLSVALRHSWFYVLSGEFLFWIWMPFVGFDPLVVIILKQVCMLYQSWLHTELIRKLPPVFEWVFNTPSHHRVHHGTELKYLDKNHAAILILWDRLFGTFQAEEEKPSYGLTEKPVNTHFYSLQLHGWTKMFTRAWSSGSAKNFFRYLLKPPGWSHDGTSQTVQQQRGQADKASGVCFLFPELQFRNHVVSYYRSLPEAHFDGRAVVDAAVEARPAGFFARMAERIVVARLPGAVGRHPLVAGAVGEGKLLPEDGGQGFGMGNGKAGMGGGVFRVRGTQ